MSGCKAVFAVLLVAGCAGVDVQSTVAPGANLDGYRTFGWYSHAGVPDPPETICEQHIKSGLEKQLQRRGITLVSNGEPDFVVAYHIVEPHQTTVTDWGQGLHGWAPQVTSYTDGTLILDFIDPRTNKIFWRGTATGVLKNPRTVDVKRINRSIALLVDQIPPTNASRPRL